LDCPGLSGLVYVSFDQINSVNFKPVTILGYLEICEKVYNFTFLPVTKLLMYTSHNAYLQKFLYFA